jgi:uncharacterized protein (DUF2147 family)
MKHFPLIFFALISLGNWSLAQGSRSTPIGLWLNADGDARARIAPCGMELCGTVVWQKTPYFDTKNPDPTKRSRPIVGIVFLTNFKPDGPDSWKGTFYLFDEGITVTAKAKLVDPNKLVINGCVMWICDSDTWTRVNEAPASH